MRADKPAGRRAVDLTVVSVPICPIIFLKKEKTICLMLLSSVPVLSAE